MNDSNGSSATLEVFSSHLEDFREWFLGLVRYEQPDLVVAIARSAVRFIELAIDDWAQHLPMVSDSALPFLRDPQIRGKKVLLVDDSLIWGSTMARIREYLLDRGAAVVAGAFVIDREEFLGERRHGRNEDPSDFSTLPVRWKHAYWSDIVTAHHHSIVRAVLGTTADYNLDFPTFHLSIPEIPRSAAGILLNLLKTAPEFQDIVDVTDRTAAASGVFRYSARLQPWTFAVFSFASPVRERPYSKIRITYSPETGVVRITPIPQYVLQGDYATHDVILHDPAAQDLWNRLDLPLPDDPFYPEALLRIATALGAALAGSDLTRSICDTLACGSSPALDRRELALVLGKQNAALIDDFVTPSTRVEGTRREGAKFAFADTAEPIDPALIRKMRRIWDLRPHLRLEPSDTPAELLGKTFKCLRDATDSRDERHDNPHASRLDVGLTFGELEDVLDGFGIEVSSVELSYALDGAVDRGNCVPKIVTRGDVVLRVFYSGEASSAEDRAEFKGMFHQQYQRLNGEDSELAFTGFDLHKLCVTVRDLCDWIPVSTRFYTYGRQAAIPGEDKTLEKWFCQDEEEGNPGALIETEKDGRRVYLPNPEFQSAAGGSWDPHQRKEFAQVFRLLTSLFKHLGDDTKLFLSTCRTARNACNAMAFEAHRWSGHSTDEDSVGFPRLLEDLKERELGTVKSFRELAESVYWTVRYVDEISRKKRVHYKEFEKHYGLLGTLITARDPVYWDFLNEIGFFDRIEPPDVAEKRRYLEALHPMLSLLTQIGVSFILESDLLDEAFLHARFDRHGVSWTQFTWVHPSGLDDLCDDYNSLRTRVPGSSFITSGIDINRGSARFIQDLEAAVQQVGRILALFLPRYESTSEGDLEFVPVPSTQELESGAVDRWSHHAFLLTSWFTPEDPEEAEPLFDDLRSRMGHLLPAVSIEWTEDYQVRATTESLPRLIDLARAFSLEVRTRLGGTLRQTIGFGNLRVRSGDGIQILHPYSPSRRPSIFSAPDAVDEAAKVIHCAPADVLLVDHETRSQLMDLLPALKDRTAQVWVESPEYAAPAFAVDFRPGEALNLSRLSHGLLDPIELRGTIEETADMVSRILAHSQSTEATLAKLHGSLSLLAQTVSESPNLLAALEVRLEGTLSELRADLTSWRNAIQASQHGSIAERARLIEEIEQLLRLKSSGKIVSRIPLIPGLMEFRHEAAAEVNVLRWLSQIPQVLGLRSSSEDPPAVAPRDPPVDPLPGASSPRHPDHHDPDDQADLFSSNQSSE